MIIQTPSKLFAFLAKGLRWFVYVWHQETECLPWALLALSIDLSCWPVNCQMGLRFAEWLFWPSLKSDQAIKSLSYQWLNRFEKYQTYQVYQVNQVYPVFLFVFAFVLQISNCNQKLNQLMHCFNLSKYITDEYSLCFIF